MISRVAHTLRRAVAPLVRRLFFIELIEKTDNFGRTLWLGQPIWQNVLDLWVIQETIAEIRPALLVECGTNRGGSALFYAHLFDQLGNGEVVTIDIEATHSLSHPRVTFLRGSSIAPDIVAAVSKKVGQAVGPVMVILDSDHSQHHVQAELEAYARFVSPGSYCLVQDGVIDTLPMFVKGRPGPLRAIERFVATHREFEVDAERSSRFVITHHPRGWLKRKTSTAAEAFPVRI